MSTEDSGAPQKQYTTWPLPGLGRLLRRSQPFAGRISFPPSVSDWVTHSPCPRLTQTHTGTGFLRIIRKRNGGRVGSGVIPTVKRRDSKPRAGSGKWHLSVMSLSHTELRFPREVPKSESLSAVRWSTHPTAAAGDGALPACRGYAPLEPPSASPQFSKGDETVIKEENDHCPKRGAY